MRVWRVGELAKRTGVSIRTLHHYDEIGLLRPSSRSGSGYRQYGEQDLARLQQIVSLRQLGLSLDEIGACLQEPGASLLQVLESHLAAVHRRIGEYERLRDRLRSLTDRLRQGGSVSPAELIETMEMMTMFEKYYTPEQLRQLEARRAAVGEDRIREVEAEWPRLMEEVRLEMEKGTDPSDPRVQALADRWQALVQEFTGGDAGIQASVQRLYQGEDEVAGMQVGPIRELAAYMARARSSPS